MSTNVERLTELIVAILKHRDKCFIPETCPPEALYMWTERAREEVGWKE